MHVLLVFVEPFHLNFQLQAFRSLIAHQSLFVLACRPPLLNQILPSITAIKWVKWSLLPQFSEHVHFISSQLGYMNFDKIARAGPSLDPVDKVSPNIRWKDFMVVSTYNSNSKICFVVLSVFGLLKAENCLYLKVMGRLAVLFPDHYMNLLHLTIWVLCFIIWLQFGHISNCFDNKKFLLSDLYCLDMLGIVIFVVIRCNLIGCKVKCCSMYLSSSSYLVTYMILLVPHNFWL